MENDFLKGFELELPDIKIVSDTALLTCPTPPATTKVSAEGRSNYATLAPNADYYGMTGLMAMQTWNTSCYGEVRPGYIFLFPGSYTYSPPPYSGTVRINCQNHSPMTPAGGGTLHGQMCALLGRPTTDFIGFAVSYPYNSAGNVGYNSGTCNPHYFGSRTIPTDCNGTNWQQIIYNTLATWLK